METTEHSSVPALAALYGRAVIAPLIPGGGGELPDREHLVRGAPVDAERVAAYARVCGFGVRDEAPATYPHLLAFPLQLDLMTGRDFPFSVLGMVHVANRIELLAPIPVGSELDVRVWAKDLRGHHRGTQMDLMAEAELGGEAVYRACSTYLHREPRDGESSDDGPKIAGDDGDDASREEAAPSNSEPVFPTAEWRLPADLGRRYASVSGDRNPIHMHGLTARLFGFPGAIVHGMWTKARCLAAFEGRLPDTFAIEIEFRAPLRIPGRVTFLSGRSVEDWMFEVRSRGGERSHAAGAIAPA
jgi:acyl dehydratase